MLAAPRLPPTNIAPSKTTPHVLATFARIFLVVVGGYMASSGVVSGLAVLSSWVGVPRSEGVLLASMLGFFVYLILLLWSFAERRLWRIGAGFALLASLGMSLAALIGSGA